MRHSNSQSPKLGERLGDRRVPGQLRMSLQGEFDPFTLVRPRCPDDGLRGDHRPMFVRSDLPRGAVLDEGGVPLDWAASEVIFAGDVTSRSVDGPTRINTK
jgi:hypothetical protein